MLCLTASRRGRPTGRPRLLWLRPAAWSMVDLNGVDRAELGARVAADAVFLVDVDDAAEFSLSEITLVGGSVLPVGAGAGVERTNLDRIVGH